MIVSQYSLHLIPKHLKFVDVYTLQNEYIQGYTRINKSVYPCAHLCTIY